MRFRGELCRSAGVDWDAAAKINAAMDSLTVSRHAKIELNEILIKSKVAWKFATLRQALTYRLVDLGDATIAEWNSENLLASVVLARAFLETAALVHSVTMRMGKALECGSIFDLNKLATQESFGARRADWVAENGLKATNVLTALDHMANEIEFVRDFYEHISETAHPNAFGVGQFYASIDTENIIVHLSRTKRSRAAIFSQIGVALFCAQWSVEKLERFDQMVEEIAALHALLDAADR